MYYIGVDLGTSSMKMILMDNNGVISKSINEEYDIYYPIPTWSEQNPEEWWSAFKTGVARLTDGIDRDKIGAISFGGQMHGLVILDKEDKVIRPAILWNDGRSVIETEYLNNVIGVDTLLKETGNIAFAGFTAPKIMWVKKDEPENFSQIAKIMLPKDYLLYKLTGVHATDISDASGMLLLDVGRKDWSDKMLEICDVSRDQLPKLFESYDIVGNVLSVLCDELGLSPSTKVVAGAGDNAAAAIGTGTVGNASCNISIGTSGTIFIGMDNFVAVDGGVIHSFGHSDGKYHLLSCMLSAASCNKWWMDDILSDIDYKAMQENMELGENNIFFLPYLMGERSPHNDVNARGTFIGMTMDSTRTQMSQAVLEGVAFAIRDSFEIAKSLGIDVKKTKICGGGAKSDIWQKIFANVLNISVEILENEEGPALGACILAAVANGEYSDIKEATERIVKVKDVVNPHCELAEKYDRKYTQFRKIYPALKPIFALMAER